MVCRWGAVCLLMCLGVVEAQAQQAAPAVKVPPGLIGTWTVIEEQANGMPTTPQTGNFVVTADRCFWGKTPFTIARIETQLAPYKINLVTDGEPPVAKFTVIYEQDGDKLRLSMPRGDNSQVPQQFVAKAGDPWAIFTCRRAPDIATSPLKTAPDVDATLLQAINEMLTPLEAKNMRAFFVASYLPIGLVPTRANFPKSSTGRCRRRSNRFASRFALCSVSSRPTNWDPKRRRSI